MLFVIIRAIRGKKSYYFLFVSKKIVPLQSKYYY